MTASLHQIRVYLGTLTATLRNYGASLATPTLNAFETGERGFQFEASMPGPPDPRSTLIRMAELWVPESDSEFRRIEYAYDFIEHPLNRRRSFHGHDPEHFGRQFGVLVHEHCEEVIGRPECSHYYGLPVDGYEAIRRFSIIWGQPGSLGCESLRCMA